jgi:AmmeMemoRadiSam system protein A
MTALPEEERAILLKLARSAIASELIPDAAIIRPESISLLLSHKRGCFVTLHKKGSLRGCIGTIEPVNPLIESVKENALNAAFHDPRFPPLTADELPDVDIEISILSVPAPLAYDDVENLKQKLRPHVHGVIISRGYRRSTFLPQVWKQLPDVESFLDHLCLKGGLSRKAWKDKETQVSIYTVEYFSENR